MSLSAAEIAAVVAELKPLVGARVDAVRVHAERSLTLELFGRMGSVRLLVSAESDLTRLHVTEARPRSPDQPYAFQSLLRRELEGARLVGLEAIPGDRVVRLQLEQGAHHWTLVAELTGRHGNLFLVSSDGIVRASAARNLSQRRQLTPGEPYVAPAPTDRPDAAEALAGAGQPAAISDTGFSLSAAIEKRYRALEEERALAEERRRLREPIRATLARTRRTLVKLAEEADRVPQAEVDRRAADLIKLNLHALRRGTSEALVTEYTAEGPRQTRIALDPALGPRENMERYYGRYRRIVESANRVAERAAEMRLRERSLLALLQVLEGAALEELPRCEREARRLGAGLRPAAAPRRRREQPVLPYRQFRSLTGAAILVGRSAAQNDTLTVRHARGNDLWLHARGRPGSHVVLRLEKGQGPDQESLLDAAHLAAHFSESRGEVTSEVIYTRAKYVRKTRGAAPGAVIYSQERTLLLRWEAARLERLLANEEVQPS